MTKSSKPKAPAQTQREMWEAADRRSRNTLAAFVEIQQSGNPLTPEEIEALAAKRPDRYRILLPAEKYRKTPTNG